MFFGPGPLALFLRFLFFSPIVLGFWSFGPGHSILFFDLNLWPWTFSPWPQLFSVKLICNICNSRGGTQGICQKIFCLGSIFCSPKLLLIHFFYLWKKRGNFRNTHLCHKVTITFVTKVHSTHFPNNPSSWLPPFSIQVGNRTDYEHVTLVSTMIMITTVYW